MTTPPYSQNVQHHGGLLANIPAILGFYPKDSVIVALAVSDDNDVFTLGPLARLDLDEAVDIFRDSYDSLTDWFDDIGAVAAMIYVVSDKHSDPYDDPRIMSLISFLGDKDESPITNLRYVVHTPQIITDEKWQVLYKHDQIHGEPISGYISPLTDAAEMQYMVNNTGQVPEMDRDDVIAMLNNTVHGLDPDVYADIIEDVTNYTPPVSDNDGAYSAKSYSELRAVYEQASSGIDQPTDPSALRAGMKCFTTLILRDALLAVMLDNPDAGFVFARQLMRTVPLSWTDMRSQVTAIVAILAQATKQPALSCSAARHAVAINSETSLSDLVAQVTVLGRGDRLVEITYNGAVMARNKLYAK